MNPQIDTELTRIEGAKAAIKQAIEAKGGTVGSGTIDTYAEAIATIPTSSGGGKPDFATHSDAYMAYKNRGTDDYIYVTDSSYIEQLATGFAGDRLSLAWEIWFAPKVSELTQITTFNHFLQVFTQEGREPQYVSYSRVEGIEYFTSVTDLGDDFLASNGNLTTLMYPITLPPNVVNIGDRFLQNQIYFDFPLVFPGTLRTIGGYFMYMCNTFNQTLTFPNEVNQIGICFLNNMSAFNQPIAFPSSLTKLEYSAISNLQSFNSPITFPSNLTEIDRDCLRSLNVFNQPVDLPDTVTIIGSGFLSHNEQFNSPVHLSNTLSQLGAEFMDYTANFAQPLVLPATLATINLTNYNENRFMQSCDSFLGPLTINNPAFPFDDGYNTGGILSTYNQDAPSYTTGVSLQGAGASIWKSKCPDQMAPYRKLVLA